MFVVLPTYHTSSFDIDEETVADDQVKFLRDDDDDVDILIYCSNI